MNPAPCSWRVVMTRSPSTSYSPSNSCTLCVPTMPKMTAMAAAAFVLTLALGYPGVAMLRRAGIGKQVSAHELASHASKTGTPTMGGVLFIAPAVALVAAVTLTWRGEGGRSVLLPVLTLL